MYFPWSFAYACRLCIIAEVELNVRVYFFTGTLTPDGLRRDVSKEIVLYTDITDETSSHYIGVNLRRCHDPHVCLDLLRRKDEKFIESNKMYHINGYVYGNLPGLDVCEGSDVAIYTFSLAEGIHTMQIYGQTFVIKNHR